MLSTNKILTTVLLAVLSLGHSLSGLGVEFAGPVSYPVGGSPAAVVIADFNGDGKPDLAVVNSGSGNISILFGNGDGTYKPAVNFDAGMASPTSIEVADFNNDGIQDLAAWSLSGPVDSTLSVLLGNGDGTFQAAKRTALPATVDQSTLDLAIADFTLDRKHDLALLLHDANGGGSSRIIFLAGNGDGTFQSPRQGSDILSTVVGSNVKYLVAGDFNDDGKPDLAVQVSGGIEILLGQGDGTFHARATVPIAVGIVSYLEVADFNGDNKVDLLTKSDRRYDTMLSHVTDSSISLFFGKGDGSFQPEEHIQTTELVSSAEINSRRGRTVGTPAAGDFNGDGRLDLTYPLRDYDSMGSASPGIRLRRPDGTFSPLIRFESPNPDLLWTSLVARDLNGDKLTDLIFPDILSNAIVVELNIGPTSGADLGIIASQVTGTSYSAIVLNEGPADAAGVTFADRLPNGVSLVSASTTQGSCTESNGSVTCPIGPLASGGDAAVTLAVALKPTAIEGTITNTMNVTAVEQDLTPANNSATQDSAVFTLTVATAGAGSGTVTSNPPGIDCGAACSQRYMSGSSMALVPTASEGSVFSGWSGDCDFPDPNGCAMPINSNMSVTATFDKATNGSGDQRLVANGGGGGGLALVDLCGLLLPGLWRAFRGGKRQHHRDAMLASISHLAATR